MRSTPRTIAVIVKYFYPVAAGIETNILETYSILAQKGWNITIYTTTDNLTEKNIYSSQETLRGLHIKRIPSRQWLFWPRHIPWSDIDIVCLHNFNVMPHALIMLWSWFKRMRQKKNFTLILTPHGGYNPEWSIFHPVVAFFKRTYHFTIGAFLINRAVDGVRAVSEWERKEIIAHGVLARKVKTISNGIEDEAYRDVDAEASDTIRTFVQNHQPYIIQIGRIYPIKNYETTIRALAELSNKKLHYVIAGPIGSVAYEASIRKLASELGVEKRVIFVGVIRGIDKYYLIRHAEMMVHMAIWESFCNVVHEGLSQGLPCIVADNTALPLLVRHEENGYVLPTQNVRKLAHAIDYIMTHKNSSEIQNMRERNREFGLRHSWKSVAEEMHNWYRSLYIQ